MKKSVAIFSFILCFLLAQFGAFASDTPIEDKSSTEISVSFKAGSDTYLVNGKNVKAEPSAQTGGKTFVPVKVITDALGASLKVDLKTKIAVITYNSVDITLTEKKKEAIISGKKVTIDAAPYIKNNSFMASISSLADILGADVKTSDGKITFLKEIANPNSIKDFSALIKDTNKSKVGDSYYKWSMQLPDDLRLEYRNFNGTTNEFVAADESYFISISIYDRNKENDMDSIANDILDELYDYTLIDYEIKRKNGTEFLDFVYRNSYSTYQERVFLTNTKIYDIVIGTKNNVSYSDEKYGNILESFKLTFSRDGSTEDLSDVNADGFRKYQETGLNWSINLLPDLRESKDNNIQNRVYFYGKNDFSFSVKIYSLDKGETLESLTENYEKEDSDYFNPELYKILKKENVVVNGIKCNKVYYSMKYKNETHYGCDIFLVDKNYKYLLWYEVSEEDYRNANLMKKIEGMVNSFTIREIDAKTVGKLLDPDKVVLSDKKRTVSGDIFSMDVPINWKKNIDTDMLKNYGNDSLSVTVTVIDKGDNSFTEFIKFLEENMSDLGYKVNTNTTVSEKGVTCKKYIVYYTRNDIEYRDEVYIFQKGNKIMTIDLIADNLFYGTKNSKILNDVWQSFTLK